MKGLVVGILALFCSIAAGKNIEAFERIPQKIVGGTETTINNYPYAVAMLTNGGWSATYSQSCGGTILTSTAILSAAHCYNNRLSGDANPSWWRIRVGSTASNSGGQVINIARLTNHNQFSWSTYDYDVAVLRTASTIVFGSNVAAASIAGANYNLADNSPVWAIGWGSTFSGGSTVTNLRHVQVWTVNQNTCNARYGGSITARMLCSGWLDVGGADQCQGDSGGPLIHNNVIVGVCSWGNGCASAYWPGVNTRVSAVSAWIVTQAQA